MSLDDSTDLQQRVFAFNQETLKLYREDLGVTVFSHHQDERTISTYLAAYDSNKYPFYKSSFYTRFCKLLGVNPKSRGEKYVHYKQLLEDFIREYILHDKELLDLKAGFFTDDCHDDTSNYILPQDDQTFVIDTKWKTLRQPRPADQDLQQMYAYTKYFDSEHTLLLYPGEKDEYYQGHFYPEGQPSKNKGYPCSMITIGLNEGERLEEWMSRIGGSVQKGMVFRLREGL